MNRYFTKSFTPKNKNLKEKELIDYNSIRLPKVCLGFTNKSLGSIKKNLEMKTQYSKAIRALDISPDPNRYRNPFKSGPEHLLKTAVKRSKWAHDFGIDEFIDAMFFNVNNSYRLLNKDLEAPIDHFNAEIQIRNLKRLKPVLKGLEPEDADKTPLENFWLTNVGFYHIVRWDVFEESLCRYFILNINTSIGRIRKLNWNMLLKKLYKKIVCKSTELELWPGHPGLGSISYQGPVVTLENFQSCITSSKFKSLVSKSIGLETFYLEEKFKKENYIFACGSEYKGGWKSYRRDGLARLELIEDLVYEGYFYKGLRHGYGKCEACGTKYKGYWDEDLLDGRGEILYFDLSEFQGVWSRGKLISGNLKWSGGEYTGYFTSLFFEGQGTFVDKTGNIKKGLWSKGKLNGQGEVILKNNSVYKGVFKEEFLEGIGFIETQSYIYNGETNQSQPHGKGKILFKSNNSEYEGNFLEGIINGKGVYKINNETLKGEFIHGKLTGKGEKLFNTASNYIGDFSDSLMHGKGVLRFSNGNFKGIYTGEFRINKFHGNGKLRIDNAEYRGSMAMGEMHGVGELFLTNTNYKGNFFKGEIKGKGSVHFYDGSFYTGEWSHGKPNGSGEASDSNGYWIASNFLEGVPIMRHKLNTDFFNNIQDFCNKVENFGNSIRWINDNLTISKLE